MILPPDTVRALNGASLLARFDRSGLSYFDNTIDGFWYSFRAAFLIAPVFLFLSIARLLTADIEMDIGPFLATEIASYTLGWLAFPVVMEWLTRTMGCRDKFVAYLIAYNWAMVPQYILYVGVIILELLGIIPVSVSAPLSLLILMWALTYSGFIAKTVLEVSLSSAIGIVVLDLLLGLMLDQMITG